MHAVGFNLGHIRVDKEMRLVVFVTVAVFAGKLRGCTSENVGVRNDCGNDDSGSSPFHNDDIQMYAQTLCSWPGSTDTRGNA